MHIYSNHPFPFRKKLGLRQLDDWQQKALETLEKRQATEVKEFTTYNNSRALRYATPMIMNDKCVKCHNEHPQTPKKGWERNDVRGVLEIIRPLDEDIEETQKQLAGVYLFLAVTAVALLAACGLVLGRYRR